uniref:Uncharacterized protein n=1 Tax=Onchocerca volvulus TaxID=6282 RepID=A0A8R1XXL3_ONCVO
MFKVRRPHVFELRNSSRLYEFAFFVQFESSENTESGLLYRFCNFKMVYSSVCGKKGYLRIGENSMNIESIKFIIYREYKIVLLYCVTIWKFLHVNKKSSHMRAVKIFMIYYGTAFAPFVINSSSNGILNLRNAYSNDWIAIRILTKNSELNIYSTKFLLPPGRTSVGEVTMKNNLMDGKLPSRASAHCPARNVNTLWTRPYYVPRDQWHYKIIRIHFDLG